MKNVFYYFRARSEGSVAPTAIQNDLKKYTVVIVTKITFLKRIRILLTLPKTAVGRKSSKSFLELNTIEKRVKNNCVLLF